jgi:DNA-binding XRE family transcriptional regulator
VIQARAQLDKKPVPFSQAEKVSKDIGELVTSYFRGVRKSQRITQAALAEALGVTTQTVKSLEAGRTRWNIDNIVKVAAVLSVDLHDLFASLAADFRDGVNVSPDPLLAEVIGCYNRRDLPGMLGVMRKLSLAWNPDQGR